MSGAKATVPVKKVLVSVRRVLESYESVVIQGWWPDSRRVTIVDEQEPQTLRPQQAALPERFDRRRMEAGRTPDPTWQARRGVCPNARENGQIRPSTIVRAARGAGTIRTSRLPCGN